MHGPSADEESDGPIAAINIIPLVDVVLVLLIIFMVTTVFTRDSAMKLELPKGSRNQPAQSTAPVQITVTVDKNGAVSLNGAPTEVIALGEKISAFKNTHGKTLLVLRGDKAALYGSMMPVLDEVSRTGVEITLAYLPDMQK